MYAKLFASILDSSIWLEDPATRIVWVTLLAAKDQEGFARFAAVENLARRANVSVEQAQAAVAKLEAPDERSSNPEHEGRRIERVPGGWVVLNAQLYDEMVRRDDERRATRERVRRHREKTGGAQEGLALGAEADPFERAWALYPKRAGGNSKQAALKAWTARLRDRRRPGRAEEMIAGVERYAAYVRAKGDEGTEFVKQAVTFFGPAEHWKETWSTNGNGARSRGNARAGVDAGLQETLRDNPDAGRRHVADGAEKVF